MPARRRRTQHRNRPNKDEADQKTRVRSLDNLKMIALAMHNVAGSTDQTRFPAAAIRKDGRPAS